MHGHKNCAAPRSAMPLTAEDVASIATVENYIHDEQQAYLMLYGEGLFDTIPIEQDYTVADIKLWIKHHKELAADKYDLVGPWPRWKIVPRNSRNT